MNNLAALQNLPLFKEKSLLFHIGFLLGLFYASFRFSEKAEIYSFWICLVPHFFLLLTSCISLAYLLQLMSQDIDILLV